MAISLLLLYGNGIQSPLHHNSLVLVYLSHIAYAICDMFKPAAYAATADLCPGSTTDRGVMMSALSMAETLGVFLGTGVGLGVLTL
jgi:hypothetical protein